MCKGEGFWFFASLYYAGGTIGNTKIYLGPQNHEKWRFYTPNIWGITPKNGACGFPWYITYIYIYVYSYMFSTSVFFAKVARSPLNLANRMKFQRLTCQKVGTRNCFVCFLLIQWFYVFWCVLGMLNQGKHACHDNYYVWRLMLAIYRRRV